jgi:hypothetical protein
MNTNDTTGNRENGRWQEMVLSFQNASVYLQLLNSRYDKKSKTKPNTSADDLKELESEELDKVTSEELEKIGEEEAAPDA